jgi:hypothetical protein
VSCASGRLVLTLFPVPPSRHMVPYLRVRPVVRLRVFRSSLACHPTFPSLDGETLPAALPSLFTLVRGSRVPRPSRVGGSKKFADVEGPGAWIIGPIEADKGNPARSRIRPPGKDCTQRLITPTNRVLKGRDTSSACLNRRKTTRLLGAHAEASNSKRSAPPLRASPATATIARKALVGSKRYRMRVPFEIPMAGPHTFSTGRIASNARGGPS